MAHDDDDARPPPPPLLSFGLIADVQYADMPFTHVEGRAQRFGEVRRTRCTCGKRDDSRTVEGIDRRARP